MRARTACVLTDRDGVRATDRDDERHGAGPDGERTVGTAFDMRCGYDRRVRTVRFGTTCERDGAGAAGVAAENYDVNRHGYGSMIVVENDDDGVLRELSWFLLRLMVSVYVAWWSTNEYTEPSRRTVQLSRCNCATPTLNGGPLLDDFSYFSMGG